MCFDSAWDLEVYASVGPQDLQVFQHRIVPLRPRVSVQPIGNIPRPVAGRDPSVEKHRSTVCVCVGERDRSLLQCTVPLKALLVMKALHSDTSFSRLMNLLVF